jgi:hypothetical protein
MQNIAGERRVSEQAQGGEVASGDVEPAAIAAAPPAMTVEGAQEATFGGVRNSMHRQPARACFSMSASPGSGEPARSLAARAYAAFASIWSPSAA